MISGAGNLVVLCHCGGKFLYDNGCWRYVDEFEQVLIPYDGYRVSECCRKRLIAEQMREVVYH